MDRLRGINFGGWFSQIDCIEEKNPGGFPGVDEHINTFLNQQDIFKIQSMGLNHIRLPFDWKVLFEAKNLVPKEPVFQKIEWFIRQCEDAGLKIMLDLHKSPGHDFHEAHDALQGLFHNQECLVDTKRIWQIVAERFGHYKNVMLEVLNEPVAENDHAWNRIKDELFQSVRQKAPKSPILLSSNLWGTPNKFDVLTPVEDDNVIYVVHYYAPLLFTHQYAPWKPPAFFHQTRLYPGIIHANPEVPLPQDENGRWDKNRIVQSMEPVFRFMERFQAPCVCNEFGVYVRADRNSQLNWIKDLLSVLKQANIGFSYWNYKNLDFGLLSQNEPLHKNLPQYQNPQHWDFEMAELLSRE